MHVICVLQTTPPPLKHLDNLNLHIYTCGGLTYYEEQHLEWYSSQHYPVHKSSV